MMATGDRGRVLVIDDDPLVRDLLARMLSESGGFETEVASDGVDGLDKIRNGEFDVIFTDLAMPRLDGMDLLRRCRVISPSTPVVVITGVSATEAAVAAMREGASDFITKPFKVDKILATTTRIIGEKRLLGKLPAAGDSDASLKSLNAELFKRLQEIVTLHTISQEIDGHYDNREVYSRIAELGARLLAVNEVRFGIVEDGHLRVKSAVGATGEDIPVSGPLREILSGRREYHVSDVGQADPLSGDPLTGQLLLVPFQIGNEPFGLLHLAGKADGTAFAEEEIYLALDFARKAASKIENNALYEVFFNNLVDTLRSLIATIEARDSYTKQHSERVTDYALQTAEVMGLGPEEIDLIRFGGYLHDIGKIGVRDTVLLKPGGLTPQELEEIRRHSVIGDEIVKPIKFFTKERAIIRHHHEHYNGAGYPDGFAGEQIPLIARILTVADSYEAMTSNRPYRNAQTHEYAVGELARCRATQFDPDVVRAFLATSVGGGRRS